MNSGILLGSLSKIIMADALAFMAFLIFSEGEIHDQGDAKWIVNRRSLWGHNDMPCGQPAPSRPIGHLGSGRLQSIMCSLSYN
jgi:hypothetical protein